MNALHGPMAEQRRVPEAISTGTASHTAEAFQDTLSSAEGVWAKIGQIINDARGRDDERVEPFDVCNSDAFLRALDDAHVAGMRMRDRA